MYVIISDCHNYCDIDSHYEYGIFDVDDKRIYTKHHQHGDIKCTATTTNNNKKSGGARNK